MDSASSVPPHIQPPIAQVPRAIRELTSGVAGILTRSMAVISICWAMIFSCLLGRYFSAQTLAASTLEAALRAFHLLNRCIRELRGQKRTEHYPSFSVVD